MTRLHSVQHNVTRLTRVTCAIAAAGALHSCGEGPALRGVDIAPSVAGVLAAAVDGSKTEKDIWRGDGRRLSLTSDDAVDRLKDEHKIMVMVSFPAGAPLARSLKADPSTLAYFPASPQHDGAALMGLSDTESLDWLASAAHVGPSHACGRLQVLDFNLLQDVSALTPPVIDEALKIQAAESMMAKPTAAGIAESIKQLEDLGTRHHASASGVATSAKVKEMFEDAAEGKLPQLSIAEVAHANTPIETDQKSVVATLAGATDDATTVVIGAHLDSINANGVGEPAPGADDDASGVATIVEVIKALAASGAKFARRVEFHAYAAEEVGLVGSAAIAETYRNEARNVAAMLQLDMNAWNADPAAQTIFIVTKDTNITLRRSLKDLMNTYLGGNFAEKTLAAGTSDHKSWSQRGFPAVFPFEDPDNYNHRLHTPDDTSAAATNTALAARFAKLVLAFLAHHAGLVGTEAEASTKLAEWRADTPRDLKLAVAPGSVSDSYLVSIATPTDIQAVEVCAIEAAGATGCTRDLVTTTLTRTDADRAFFAVDEEMPLADGSRLAVFGYNAADALVMQRSVRLDAK